MPGDLPGESVFVINTAKLAVWVSFVSASLKDNCGQWCCSTEQLGQRPDSFGNLGFPTSQFKAPEILSEVFKVYFLFQDRFL